MSLFRGINQLLSPGGPRGRLSIMIFHRVLRAPDPLRPTEPDAARFEADLCNVARWFNVLPLRRAVTELAAGTLPPRALAITFDDGYADNHDVALPILQRLRVPATFFVASGYLDGGAMWNDRVTEAVRQCAAPVLDLEPLGLPSLAVASTPERLAAIEALLGRLKYEPPARREELAAGIVARAKAHVAGDLMMTSAQVRALAAAGMEVGAHTHLHPILARIPPEAARAEIEGGKRALENLLQDTVRLFAYPNGKPGKDYTRVHVEQARAAGFEAACSTAHGVAAPGADVLQLPRFTPWDREAWRYGARLSRNLRTTRFELAGAPDPMTQEHAA